MKHLITTREAIALALPSNSYITEGNIAEYHIRTAQRKYIIPAIGANMVEAMTNGMYNDLFESYVKQTLALYTLYIALPQIVIKINAGGALQATPDNHKVADANQVNDLRLHYKKCADSLLRELVEHIIDQQSSYPEFDIAKCISKQVINVGGLIIT